MSSARGGRWPGWVVGVIAALSLVEPLTHVWIQQFPPEGAVHTGMHVGDSALMQHWTDSIVSGFYSPWCTEEHRLDGRDWRLYMAPYTLLYGVFGVLNRALRIDPFLYLGLVNGLGCALYLAAAWRFLREVVPRHARRAFLLFTLGGGLGGVAYVVCAALGWTDAPDFTRNFERLAHYELIEGQHLAPLLLATRLYYTIPLAAGLLGLTLFLRGGRAGQTGPLAAAGLLFAFAGLVNLRLGPLFAALAVAWVALGGGREVRLRAAAWATVPALLATAAGWWMMGLSYHFRENAAAITGMATWLVPFLTTTVFFWVAAMPALRRRLACLPAGASPLAWAAVGYLVAYLALYTAHVAWYGNWLAGGETSAAVLVSDYALPGGLLGMAFAMRRRPSPAPADDADRAAAWLTLWILGFTALTVSAFGQGWFLRFSPQRLLVLLPLPLAAMAAMGLDAWPRRGARMLLAVTLAGGLASMAVATLFFQGPLGRRPGEGPFAYLHYAYVTGADAELMDALPPGTVLAPPWSPIYFGEILSLRPGLRVLGGGGGANLCELRYTEVQPLVDAFFAPLTGEEERRGIVDRLHVETVFCPDTCPVDPAVLEALDRTPWIHETATAARGRVYAVTPGP